MPETTETRRSEPPEATRYRPFHCGTQLADWESSNCARCTKGDGGGPESACPILIAISQAYVGDGTVSEEMARRMGHLENRGRYVWPCGEVDWTEEWLASRVDSEAEGGNGDVR